MLNKIIFFAAALILAEAAHTQQLFTAPPATTQSRVSSFENLNGTKGGGGRTNQGAKGNAFEPLAAGETKTLLDVHNPGIIQRIWCTVSDMSPNMLRSLRLRMYWDGSPKPAVDVPLGDFFNAPLGKMTAFQSALFADPEGRSFLCYIPMPFRKSARVTLTNESNTGLYSLYFDIDFTTIAQAPADMLYFHACWNRAKKVPIGQDFELLPIIHGRGRFLGVNIGVNVDSVYGKTWWGEGEVKYYIDGDKTNPTINGTGTEDFAGAAWEIGPFAQLYNGCLVADEKSRQYSFYRFHVPDAIYFQKDFRATIQEIGGGYNKDVQPLIMSGTNIKLVSVQGAGHQIRLIDSPISISDPKFPNGWVNFYRSDDYSATSYFYLDSPSGNPGDLAPLAERIN